MDNNMLKFIEIRNSYYYPKLGELSINEQALIEYERFCIELIKKCEKQKEVINDYKEDISNLLDIINKNCNELKCTSDEWLVIKKYQEKEVSE